MVEGILREREGLLDILFDGEDDGRGPGQRSDAGGTVLGIQTPAKFTPLPPKVQRLIMRQQVFLRLPAW